MQAILISRVAPSNLLFTEAILSNSEIALIEIKLQFRIQEQRGRVREKKDSPLSAGLISSVNTAFFLSLTCLGTFESILLIN